MGTQSRRRRKSARPKVGEIDTELNQTSKRFSRLSKRAQGRGYQRWLWGVRGHYRLQSGNTESRYPKQLKGFLRHSIER